MTSSTKSVFTTAAIIVALLVITTRTAEGQQADCASKEVVSTQLPCLCNLYNNPGMLAGINITQALELPKHCNLSADTSKCKEAVSPTSSAVPPPVEAFLTFHQNILRLYGPWRHCRGRYERRGGARQKVRLLPVPHSSFSHAFKLHNAMKWWSTMAM
ncbi:unnamed protein product [Fraxinus pennsylvanica]|uniref:Bifunctional inhibitor/plant lipid transfer protein/seed storage helical domain-containing protein n=1 Tax=Fraxinus pennsylvanica TaxID=56036 RepID=A0AAD2DI22_9LAMI|nr:unnamed protein product [Fraxinus pennsylvanica]